MNNLIIKKWIEPYRLLETVKASCRMTDLTFDGANKTEKMNKMFALLENDCGGFALYMKNVNKFYVFKPNDDFDLVSKLIEIFEFTSADYEINQDCEYALSLIDMGKAEASFINV